MTHSFDQGYWDDIWQGDRAGAMSTSEANPHLVREVGSLAPGTAIDAGCGAGAEAIWLAQQGWRVTGADVAAGALTHAEQRAAASGVEVDWVRADLATWDPGTTYDLVTTHYAHPTTPQLEFYDRLASWVAPGGTLFIVGHLHHAHGKGHAHDHGHEQPPAEASVTAADITALLDPGAWTVVTAEELHRDLVGPGGHPTRIHDVVVRATRRR